VDCGFGASLDREISIMGKTDKDVYKVKGLGKCGTRRVVEDISLGSYILLTLAVVPYMDSSFGDVCGNFWRGTGQIIGVICVVALLIVGMRLAGRFGPYWLWGWRETFAVTFLFFYYGTGWLVRPQEGPLKESAWIVCILIQGIALACALYLEAWFHGKQGHKGCIESRTLANQTCWRLFAASWTALAAAIVVAGIVISFGGVGKMDDELKGQEDLVCVIKYLIIMVITVFLWIMRPCFQKSWRIISELEAGIGKEGEG